jgi:ribonuclease VapC
MAPGLELHPDTRTNLSVLIIGKPLVLDNRADPILSSKLDLLLGQLSVIVVPVTPAHARLARQAHREYGRGSGHPARLDFGDCFSYALAKETGEPLLFKGTDFAQTDITPAI